MLIILISILLSTPTFTSAASPTDIVRLSCTAVAYPSVCVRSLSPFSTSLHRNSHQLAHVALTVSAVRTREASTYISQLSSSSKPKPVIPSLQSNAFQDCNTTMAESARKLRRSVSELSRLGKAGNSNFALRLSNVKTWVSAALTDQSMCLSSLSEAGAAVDGAAMVAVEKKVMEVSQVTSNALSFVNKITG